MIKTIYLDMDGVICNFIGRYEELFEMGPDEARDRKEFSSQWAKFVTTEQFKTLDWWPGGQRLLHFISTIKNVNVEMLTSSGGAKFHDLVTEQKLFWLKSNNINYKANVVPGRKLKAQYADSTTLLIDDTPDVIEGFVDAGGHGILHKDVDDTIKKIQSLIYIVHK